MEEVFANRVNECIKLYLLQQFFQVIFGYFGSIFFGFFFLNCKAQHVAPHSVNFFHHFGLRSIYKKKVSGEFQKKI